MYQTTAVVSQTKAVDYVKAEAAMRDFLEALGQDLTDPNLRDTPKRVTKMYAEEILAGTLDGVKLTTFDTPNSGNQFVVVTSIPVTSMCSHHLMPIRGVAHVGAFFIAGEEGTTRLPGLSKYARIVEAYSRRLQLQERLTNQIADEIYTSFRADFVYVMINAEHMCMSHRGVRVHDSETLTTQQRHSQVFLEHGLKIADFIADFHRQIQIKSIK